MTPTIATTLRWHRNIAEGGSGRRYEISVGRKGYVHVLTIVSGDAAVPNYKGTLEQCLEYADAFEATQAQIERAR